MLTVYITKGVKSNVYEQMLKYVKESKKTEFIMKLDEVKNKRSHAQNRLYWVVLSLIVEASQGWGTGDFDGWTSEDFHHTLSEKYLRIEDPKTKRMYTRSTTSLTVEEFSNHLNLIIDQILVKAFNGVFVDKYSSLYKEAMGVK